MQTAGNLIASAAEFAAGVQNGEHNLHGGNSHLRLNANRNAASIVHNGDGVVAVNVNINIFTVSGQSLVDTVVHNLIHKMVEPPFRSRTYVHTRPFANGFKAF